MRGRGASTLRDEVLLLKWLGEAFLPSRSVFSVGDEHEKTVTVTFSSESSYRAFRKAVVLLQDRAAGFRNQPVKRTV